ncbi:unnamed protein product [Gordionus sp. m RMFG-2023]
MVDLTVGGKASSAVVVGNIPTIWEAVHEDTKAAIMGENQKLRETEELRELEAALGDVGGLEGESGSWWEVIINDSEI